MVLTDILLMVYWMCYAPSNVLQMLFMIKLLMPSDGSDVATVSGRDSEWERHRVREAEGQ